MNLSGFCAADPAQCRRPGQAPRGAPSVADEVRAARLNPQTAGIFGAVRSALYRVAAAVGRNVACPLLPTLGEGVGLAAAGLVAAETVTLTLGSGVVIAIGVEELGGFIGRQVGEAVKGELCG